MSGIYQYIQLVYINLVFIIRNITNILYIGVCNIYTLKNKPNKFSIKGVLFLLGYYKLKIKFGA